MKPSKRSALQSPNPVKHFAADLEAAAEPVPSIQHAPVDVVASAVAIKTQPKSQGGSAVQIDDAAGSASDNDTSRSSVADASPPSCVRLAPRPGAPLSPLSNRDRFMAGFTPLRTCCNLDLCRAPAGTKLNLQAICIAVFPATTNPDRRYVQLADNTGVVGVTVWNDNVKKFGINSVGSLVTLQKAVISTHNGKKQLSLARDSIVKIGGDEPHEVCSWWSSLLRQIPKSCGAVHDISENTIVSVSGVLGRVSSETKIVHSEEKLLTCLHLVDASGRLDIRSWNQSPDVFTEFVDRPILVQRVKVASFASTKLCELLDSTGSVILSEFPGKEELSRFWSQ